MEYDNKLLGVCLDEYLVKGYWKECSNWVNKILKMVKHSDIRARDLKEGEEGIVGRIFLRRFC